ncbi:MAG: hypothetical protein ABIK78_02870 [candidate division WOR-3 bacterium]
MIHLTFSQKRFIKETIEVLSIFYPEIESLIKEKLAAIKKLDKNRFRKGEIFFSFIFSLRYPILSRKLAILKNYKIPQDLEFDEDNFPFREEIKNIINQL